MRPEFPAVPAATPVAAVVTAPRPALADFLELTKPTVVWLILLSTAVGFYLASAGPLDVLLLLHTLAGTALLAAGTGALNQWLERGLDAKMLRTRNRPLPAGRLQSRPAFWFGVALSVAGVAYLLAAVNSLAALTGFLTLASYLGLYTPLKTRTPLATFVGAFPGAAPPLIGWAAAAGHIGLEGWLIFAILFLWQFPHFYAIAWIYREDYGRAGIRMLPVIEPDGVSTGRRIIWYAAVLVPISLAPSLAGMTGKFYFVAALLLSTAYLASGLRTASAKTTIQARKLLRTSVLYLPLLYVFLVLDKT